jgi:hypothetical protein
LARPPDDDDELTPEEVVERQEEREELAAALVRARKKPRNFAIIARGKKILAIFAQKRPFRDSLLRRQRRKCKGKAVIQGVCQGDGGTKLVFRVNGERPKIKKSQLRLFIGATTGLMLKPRFDAEKTA